MGLGKFFGFSSGSSSSRPQGGHPPPNDAPPAYSSGNTYWAPDSKMSAPHKTHAGAVQSRKEDPLLALKNYDIVIILDDSYSMMIADNPSGVSRWDQAWDALVTLVRVAAEYDRNGIEIHFLNDRDAGGTVKTMAELQGLRNLVRPPNERSYTPTGDVLDTLLLAYRKQLENRSGRAVVKKRMFLVITDGAATDSPEDGIVNAASYFQKNSYPSDQVGIQFIQIGNDPEAEKFLDELDRDLTKQMGEHARDIVDTTKSNGKDLDGDVMIKVLTGGFNRRQDRMGEW